MKQVWVVSDRAKFHLARTNLQWEQMVFLSPRTQVSKYFRNERTNYILDMMSFFRIQTSRSTKNYKKNRLERIELLFDT
jgi:hypothetical protein